MENKTNINWYPGHMAKTKKQMKEDLKLIDIVVELLDSRIPISSQNPDIAEITNGKKKIIVLNKCDLSDENQNRLWVEYFKRKGHAQKGRVGRKIRVMVLGIPNVGKSSFINRISKKSSLKVANRPGVTQKNQWIRINENIELLDTPGVLWPKFESEEVALNFSFTEEFLDNFIEFSLDFSST